MNTWVVPRRIQLTMGGDLMRCFREGSAKGSPNLCGLLVNLKGMRGSNSFYLEAAEQFLFLRLRRSSCGQTFCGAVPILPVAVSLVPKTDKSLLISCKELKDPSFPFFRFLALRSALLFMLLTTSGWLLGNKRLILNSDNSNRIAAGCMLGTAARAPVAHPW